MDDDQPIGMQRPDRVRIEFVEVSRRRSDEAKRVAAPLAERPLEARLTPHRREAAAL